VPAPRLQLTAWLGLLAGTVIAWVAIGGWLAVVFLLAAQILPRQRKRFRAGTENGVTAGPSRADE